jgi:NitT/TauT family transport system substrate-binding protein
MMGMPMSDHHGRAWFLSRVAATAGVLAASRAGAETKGLTPLRIAVAPSDGVTSVAYAKASGMFERAGLDVQIDKIRTGAAVAAAIAAGSYDIGNSSVTTIFIAHEKGLPFTLVAPAGINTDKPLTGGALVPKDSPLRLGKDAEGATLGLISLSDVAHDAFCSWIEQHGGDPSSVKFVEVPFSAAAAAVAEHRVAAAETALPAMAQALNSGNFRLIPIYLAIAPTFLMSAWFTSKEFSSKHPDTVRTFARVVAAAAIYANAHPAQTAQIMSDLTSVPVADILRLPRIIQGVTLTPEILQPTITAAAKYGTLKKAFPAQELIDSSLTG